MATVVFFSLFYSGWFVWPWVYLRRDKKYPSSKAMPYSLFILLMSFSTGTLISDSIVASHLGVIPTRAALMTLMVFWCLFPYVMIILMPRKNKNK